MLAIENLEVVYDDVLLALRGVSLEVPQGAIVALLGANGAGKTTALRACTGLIPMHRGSVRSGSISLDGRRIDGRSAQDIVRAGVAQVMEGRQIFGELTVEENLRVGGYTKPSRINDGLRRMYDLFPVLEERRGQHAGYLSGGEQQMLAIGRALMSEPRYLVLDEPSLGLAPRIVEQIRDLIVRLNEDGTSILLVEQNAAMALSIAHHGFVMETGRVAMEGPAADLRADDEVSHFYLGLHEDGAPSFRELRESRRRESPA